MEWLLPFPLPRKQVFEGENHQPVRLSHTHAVTGGMDLLSLPSTAPAAMLGMFDLVWECFLASLPFKGAFLMFGLILLLCGKGLYGHTVSLAGRSGHVV